MSRHNLLCDKWSVPGEFLNQSSLIFSTSRDLVGKFSIFFFFYLQALQGILFFSVVYAYALCDKLFHSSFFPLQDGLQPLTSYRHVTRRRIGWTWRFPNSCPVEVIWPSTAWLECWLIYRSLFAIMSRPCLAHSGTRCCSHQPKVIFAKWLFSPFANSKRSRSTFSSVLSAYGLNRPSFNTTILEVHWLSRRWAVPISSLLTNLTRLTYSFTRSLRNCSWNDLSALKTMIQILSRILTESWTTR